MFHIVEPAEPDQLRVDRHQPRRAFGLQPFVAVGVDVDHPNFAFAADVPHMKLAEFARSRTAVQAGKGTQ